MRNNRQHKLDANWYVIRFPVRIIIRLNTISGNDTNLKHENPLLRVHSFFFFFTPGNRKVMYRLVNEMTKRNKIK